MKSNKLLILDLDETLVHATKKELEMRAHFRFDEYHVHRRPHLEHFLIEISKHFEIGIWSSADDVYVNEIVKQVMPPSVSTLIVWGRTKCTMRRNYDLDEYYFEKRLHKLKNKGFSLDQILIIDDSPEKMKYNYGNAIYIQEFNGNLSDSELLHLLEYLLTLKDVANVRTIEKRGWRNKT